MNKIIIDNNSEHLDNSTNQENKKEKNINPNLFQGRTEAHLEKATFPDWDILPPNLFINPRIKS